MNVSMYIYTHTHTK